MSSTVKNDSKQLTATQEFFLLGKKQLAYYDKIRETRELTAKEKFEEDKIKDNLFLSVQKYATHLINNYVKRYRIDSDAREEIMGEIKDKFFAKLDSYIPSKTTPVTFFNKDFFEEIRTYINERSQHLSPNDAGYLKRINEETKACEASGIEPTEEILHIKTGLSHKIIRQTLKKAGNTIYGDVSEVTETSQSLNPEDIYIHEETLNKLHDIIAENLSNDDIEFFMTYANLNGNKLTYKEMMQIYDMPEHEVKARITKINMILSSKANELMKIGNVTSDYNSNLNFMDSSSTEMENDILNNLM